MVVFQVYERRDKEATDPHQYTDQTTHNVPRLYPDRVGHWACDGQAKRGHRRGGALQQGEDPSLHLRRDGGLHHGEYRAVDDRVHEANEEDGANCGYKGRWRSESHDKHAKAHPDQPDQRGQQTAVEATPSAQHQAAKHHADAQGRLERAQMSNAAVEVA